MILERFGAATVGAIVLGWSLTVAAAAGGWRMEMGHHHVIEAGPFTLAGPLVFLGGWLLMVAAMMLPSSLGTIRRFRAEERIARARGRMTAAFLAGYVAVWTIVGAAALGGDFVVHEVSHRWSWLETRPWLIAATALLVAGTFQLTVWSRHCRAPERRHVRVQGSGEVDRSGALRCGAGHGAVRLRECWPVMLLSFAFGMTSLGWMVALTVLMIAERSPRLAARTALGSGLAFLAAAGLVAAAPGLIRAGGLS